MRQLLGGFDHPTFKSESENPGKTTDILMIQDNESHHHKVNGEVVLPPTFGGQTAITSDTGADKHSQLYSCELINLDDISNEYSSQMGSVRAKTHKLTDFRTQSKFFAPSIVEGNQIMARQHIFTRSQASKGQTKVLWTIYNLNENLKMPHVQDPQTRFVRSCTFMTQEGSAWALELRPTSIKDFKAKLVIHAIETAAEKASGRPLRRKLLIKPSIHKHNSQGATYEKDLSEAFFVGPNNLSVARNQMVTFT